MQLAPGWRPGANCDQYPRGDRRLGEASTDANMYNPRDKPSVRRPTQNQQCRKLFESCGFVGTILSISGLRCRDVLAQANSR
jgi:hypothetical protein